MNGIKDWPYDCDITTQGGGLYCDPSGSGVKGEPLGSAIAFDVIGRNTGQVDRPVPNNGGYVTELDHTVSINNTSCFPMHVLLFTAIQITFQGNDGSDADAEVEWNGQADLVQTVKFGAGTGNRLGIQNNRFNAFLIPPGGNLTRAVRLKMTDNGSPGMRYTYAQINTRYIAVALPTATV